MRYAEVAVEAARSIDRETYSYAVAEGMRLHPGHRVWVPFGRRESVGYVVALVDGDPGIEVKAVARADPEPLLLPYQVALARRLAGHYWAPLIECLRVMLPPRVRTGRSSGAGPSSRQTRHSRLLAFGHPDGPPEPGPPLTAEQDQAVEVIAASRRTLVHGVTGSGKTEVYLAAAARVLTEGRRVLVLVPELALGPQLTERFSRRLAVPLAVLHSGLTELERAQQWWRVRRGEVRLVVGSRSAVFAPIEDLGLVVVDEEGSSAYKQDRLPRYDAALVARDLAEVTGAGLVLGSATPTVATYAETQAQPGDPVLAGLPLGVPAAPRLALAELPRRVVGRTAPIELVDMREEWAAGRRGALSQRLVAAVDRSLAAEEQVILFLNRRGMATFVLCRACGRAVECPRCSVSLVQHPELGGLACHYCETVQPMPERCPGCGSAQIRGVGVGTQRLETIVHSLWPGSVVARLDRDAVRRPEAYLEILETFTSGRAQILVGTQLVARGLDVPTVTTVGVVDADLPLHFPDYRSAETTYQLITQVAGRAGRSERPSAVVVQTSNPDHYALLAAQRGDYRCFYQEEIAGRRLFEFPPASDLAVLTFSDPDPEKAAGEARQAGDWLRSVLNGGTVPGIRLLGPTPPFLHRLRGEYRWQLTLKGRDLARIRPHLPRGRGWVYDVDPFS